MISAKEFYQKGMELYDLGKIYKAKRESQYYNANLSLAFTYCKEAAFLIQSEREVGLAHVTYPHSAVWLAYENGYYLEVQTFIDIAMNHEAIVMGYQLDALNKLEIATNQKNQEFALQKPKQKK